MSKSINKNPMAVFTLSNARKAGNTEMGNKKKREKKEREEQKKEKKKYKAYSNAPEVEYEYQTFRRYPY